MVHRTRRSPAIRDRRPTGTPLLGHRQGSFRTLAHASRLGSEADGYYRCVVGEDLLRDLSSLSARPRLFLSVGFVLIWVAWTLGIHYIEDTTPSWGDAVGIAFFVAVAGTGLTYVIYYRRSG